MTRPSPRLIESVPNFSEGRDPAVLAAIGRAAESAGADLLDSHPDPIHNRAVVSLAADDLDVMLESLVAAVATAMEAIDMRRHSGVHPRVGAADVIPLIGLGSMPIPLLVRAAHRLGGRLWKDLGLPVHFYGLAARNPQAARLAAIRSGRVPPDLGTVSHPTAGVACVGVRRPLVAYNILLRGASPEQARDLARSLRETSGGLPGLQALVFEVAEGLQLSMNLVKLEATGPEVAHAEAARLAAAAGFELGPDEIVGLCPAGAAIPAAGGRILEARLAAAAARRGAAASHRGQGEEARRLGDRLTREAAEISGLGAEQEAVLAGAERTAALRRVLERAGVLDPASAALLGVAVDGLRAALGPEVREQYAARVEALDRWLSEPG